MKALIFITVCFLSSYCQSSKKIDCDKWRKTNEFIQVVESVLVTPSFPEDGVISEFSIVILKKKDGDIYHPNSLDEGVCILELMLNSKTRKAIEAGVIDYTKSPSLGSEEERLDKLWKSINDRVDSLYVEYGMVPGLGVSLILIKLEYQLGIRLHGNKKNYLSLQKSLLEVGLEDPHSIADVVFLSYLEQLGIAGFESRSLVNYVRK